MNTKWRYPQTLPLNAPWERSFYTAKQIDDVEEYWNNLNRKKTIMKDSYEVIDVEQGNKDTTVMEDLIHRPKVEMQYHDDLDGRTGITIRKTYLNRNDIVKGSVVTDPSVTIALKFIQEALAALNKKEI
tara:strand:+ start:508 stop:894 length:387 start_codon:yes stop_codon:yes gene_type:complete